MSARQGSAAFTIVIGAMTAVVVGAIILTFLFYPLTNALTGAAFWDLDTVAGNRVATYTAGLWEFWGAILLIGILSFVWVKTRR